MKKYIENIILLFVIGFILFTFLSNTNHDGPVISDKIYITQKQIEIINTVVSTNGYVTKEMHDEFWNEVPENIKNNNESLSSYKHNANRSIRFYERLRSESVFNTQDVINKVLLWKTVKYERNRENYLKIHGLNEDEGKKFPFIRDMDNMIDSVLKGRPYQTSQGKIALDKKFFDSILGDLSSLVRRYEILVSPEWDDNGKIYSYTDAHIAIRTLYPFSKLEPYSTYNKTKNYIISFDSSNTSTFSFISFDEYPQHKQSNSYEITEYYLRKNGKIVFNIENDTFRSLDTAKGTSAYEINGERYFITIRVINMKPYNGYVALSTTSRTSAEQSKAFMSYIEDSLDLVL